MPLPVEVMEACLAQIKRVNPKVNAICTLVDEDSLLRRARDADAQLKKSARVGPLHGFPHAVKDLVPTAGIRTTYGSRIYQDNIPAEDALIVPMPDAAAQESKATFDSIKSSGGGTDTTETTG